MVAVSLKVTVATSPAGKLVGRPGGTRLSCRLPAPSTALATGLERLTYGFVKPTLADRHRMESYAKALPLPAATKTWSRRPERLQKMAPLGDAGGRRGGEGGEGGEGGKGGERAWQPQSRTRIAGNHFLECDA